MKTSETSDADASHTSTPFRPLSPTATGTQDYSRVKAVLAPKNVLLTFTEPGSRLCTPTRLSSSPPDALASPGHPPLWASMSLHLLPVLDPRSPYSRLMSSQRQWLPENSATPHRLRAPLHRGESAGINFSSSATPRTARTLRGKGGPSPLLRFFRRPLTDLKLIPRARAHGGSAHPLRGSSFASLPHLFLFHQSLTRVRLCHHVRRRPGSARPVALLGTSRRQPGNRMRPRPQQRVVDPGSCAVPYLHVLCEAEPTKSANLAATRRPTSDRPGGRRTMAPHCRRTSRQLTGY